MNTEQKFVYISSILNISPPLEFLSTIVNEGNNDVSQANDPAQTPCPTYHIIREHSKTTFFLIHAGPERILRQPTQAKW